MGNHAPERAMRLFPTTEIEELGRKIEELEKPRAKERQATTGTAPGKPKNAGGKLPQASDDGGKTRDKVASALGVSGKTYEKAKKVVEAAEQDPDTAGEGGGRNREAPPRSPPRKSRRGVGNCVPGRN